MKKSEDITTQQNTADKINESFVSKIPSNEEIQVTSACKHGTFFITRKKDAAALFYLYEKMEDGRFKKIGKGEKEPRAFDKAIYKK